MHSSPATATTSRRSAVKHVPLVSPYSRFLHRSRVCGNRPHVYTHACIYSHCEQLLLRRRCTYWCSILVLFSGQRSFVFLCCDTRMYLRFRGCPVVLDIELSVSAWYHKTRRVLLRTRRLLLLLLLLTAESKERRLAVCGITFKPASNGAETK